MVKKLTAKQERFCVEYLKDLDATEAAIRAGYEFELVPCNKYFVYLLIDPRNNQIFYIGKGTKRRPYDHIKEVNRNKPSNQFKFNRIKEILCEDYDVEIVYFETGLEESEALQIEMSLIKTIGTKNLTNISGGTSKMSVKEHALFMLSTMLPFDVWAKKYPNHTHFEKELYFKVKEAWMDISKNGYAYCFEQKCSNGKIEIIEKRRM